MNEYPKDLEDGHTVNYAYHANDPHLCMTIQTDYHQFKMYVVNTAFSSPYLLG